MVTARTDPSSPSRLPGIGARAIVLIVLSLVLMVLDHRQGHLDRLRDALSLAVYPIQLVIDTPFRLWDWMRESSASRSELQLEIGRLRAERLLTNARLQRLSALEAENRRLRNLLDARATFRDEIRVAEIMAVDANPYRHSLIIDVGSADGVFDGQAIVDAQGVVGQVIDTGPKTSQAILISDPGHALPVEVNRNGLRTIANGTGDFDRLVLPFLPNNADIRPGDLLVTSGLGGSFPSGYPVAVVASVNRIPREPFAEVTAIPSTALNQVREVMLIWSARPATEDSVAKSGTGSNE